MPEPTDTLHDELAALRAQVQPVMEAVRGLNPQTWGDAAAFAAKIAAAERAAMLVAARARAEALRACQVTTASEHGLVAHVDWLLGDKALVVAEALVANLKGA